MHGILLDSVINQDLAEEFAAAGFRVVLCDFLGHGASDKPSDPKLHRVDFYAEQALAVLDHLHIQRAVVGGISLGAITALQFIAKWPERVRAIPRNAGDGVVGARSGIDSGATHDGGALCRCALSSDRAFPAPLATAAYALGGQRAECRVTGAGSHRRDSARRDDWSGGATSLCAPERKSANAHHRPRRRRLASTPRLRGTRQRDSRGKAVECALDTGAAHQARAAHAGNPRLSRRPARVILSGQSGVAKCRNKSRRS
ncbi:MAG: alpha/beta fold hydrolase [Nevskiales bacterium]